MLTRRRWIMPPGWTAHQTHPGQWQADSHYAAPDYVLEPTPGRARREAWKLWRAKLGSRVKRPTTPTQLRLGA